MDNSTRTIAASLFAGAASLALATRAFAQATGTTGTGTGAGTQMRTQPGATGADAGAASGSTSMQTGGSQFGMMQEADVKSLLEGQDYSEVSNVEQDGQAWKASAERDGSRVDVRVERATTLVGGNLDKDMVQTMLEAEGFEDVSNVEEDGENWTAEARRDGENVMLHLIGDEGVVVIRFLNALERDIPAGKVVHVILDNYAAQGHAKVRAWLGRHPRWTFHFTPTSASWLNAVEGFFAKFTRRRLKNGVFRSIVDLQAAINRFLAEHNRNPRPFIWRADPDAIIAARNRGFQTLESIH